MRGSFGKAVDILVECTGLPVFLAMQADNKPRPICVGIHHHALRVAGHGKKRKVKNALHRLSFSKRYLIECAKDGAQRYNAQGQPMGEVSPEHQAWALERLNMLNRPMRPAGSKFDLA